MAELQTQLNTQTLWFKSLTIIGGYDGKGLPGGSVGKELACSTGDPRSISKSERSPGEGNGNPLQCSCLENPMHRGASRATVHGVTKELDMTEVSEHAHTDEKEGRFQGMEWRHLCRHR